MADYSADKAAAADCLLNFKLIFYRCGELARARLPVFPVLNAETF